MQKLLRVYGSLFTLSAFTMKTTTDRTALTAKVELRSIARDCIKPWSNGFATLMRGKSFAVKFEVKSLREGDST